VLLIAPILFSVGMIHSVNNSLEPEDYKTWFGKNKNTFVKSQQVEEYKYDLMLVPTEMKLLNYARTTKVSKEEVKTFLKSFENFLDFSLKIEIPENGNIEFLKYPGSNGKTYEERLKHYAFSLQSTIILKTEDGKEYTCKDYVFERSFDIQPSATISFGFDRPKDLKDFQIIIHDTGFKDLTVNFPYEIKNIDKSPKLKYSKIWNKK
jgi:hypothetical protein